MLYCFLNKKKSTLDFGSLYFIINYNFILICIDFTYYKLEKLLSATKKIVMLIFRVKQIQF